ncbi:hypothetical protein M011DRAFT_481805 [Sporormia fimetaria CBS 119925]|uniref:Uncharacterized protein n=1 Tax=Sporormia fimetaria CBS 119925 TaxID=1340428 RepID=A0A6A6UX74_9PLEO|nr:hypothetical protein M011DRAFT_481805 [Sporormia fimetaria CBS 119925]
MSPPAFHLNLRASTLLRRRTQRAEEAHAARLALLADPPIIYETPPTPDPSMFVYLVPAETSGFDCETPWAGTLADIPKSLSYHPERFLREFVLEQVGFKPAPDGTDHRSDSGILVIDERHLRHLHMVAKNGVLPPTYTGTEEERKKWDREWEREIYGTPDSTAEPTHYTPKAVDDVDVDMSEFYQPHHTDLDLALEHYRQNEWKKQFKPVDMTGFQIVSVNFSKPQFPPVGEQQYGLWMRTDEHGKTVMGRGSILGPEIEEDSDYRRFEGSTPGSQIGQQGVPQHNASVDVSERMEVDTGRPVANFDGVQESDLMDVGEPDVPDGVTPPQQGQFQDIHQQYALQNRHVLATPPSSRQQTPQMAETHGMPPSPPGAGSQIMQQSTPAATYEAAQNRFATSAFSSTSGTAGHTETPVLDPRLHGSQDWVHVQPQVHRYLQGMGHGPGSLQHNFPAPTAQAQQATRSPQIVAHSGGQRQTAPVLDPRAHAAPAWWQQAVHGAPERAHMPPTVAHYYPGDMDSTHQQAQGAMQHHAIVPNNPLATFQGTGTTANNQQLNTFQQSQVDQQPLGTPHKRSTSNSTSSSLALKDGVDPRGFMTASRVLHGRRGSYDRKYAIPWGLQRIQTQLFVEREARDRILHLQYPLVTDEEVTNYFQHHINRPKHAIESYSTPVNVDIRLLGNIRITAAELLAYFPNHMKWYDAIYRLVQNGWSADNIAAYMNYARQLSGNISYKKSTMKDRALLARRMILGPGKALPSFKGTSFTAKGWAFPPLQGLEARPTDYYLVDLVDGVVNRPTGKAAGLLTRAIEMAFKNNWKHVRLSHVEGFVRLHLRDRLALDPFLWKRLSRHRQPDAVVLEEVLGEMKTVASGSSSSRS